MIMGCLMLEMFVIFIFQAGQGVWARSDNGITTSACHSRVQWALAVDFVQDQHTNTRLVIKLAGGN